MADCILERFRLNTARPLAAAAALIAALLSGSVSMHAENASPVKVSEVRFWSLGDVTRVAIEVSADFRFTSSRLPNPDRLFFDIQNARPETPIHGMKVIPVNDAVIKQIRVAEPVAGVTRVVLDLSQPAAFTASQLSNPARLMVEVRSKDKPAPPAVSHTGVKSITELPLRPAASDIASIPLGDPLPGTTPDSSSLPRVLRASVSKPEPRKFIPAPVTEPAIAAGEPKLQLIQVQPPLLTQPPLAVAMLGRPTRVPASVVPRSVSFRVSAPPPAEPTPVAARENSNGDRSLTRVLGLKLGRVVLDAGHGGHDVGTQGPTGLYEKDVVLDVAKRLGALLEARLGSEVVYTRTEDVYVALEERTRIANEHRADLFLSIHANSSPVRSVSGVETYYLNFTTSKTALDLAARENASSERSIFELKELLNKIALKDKVDESREFASRLQTSLFAISAKGNLPAANRGVKRAPFVVLIGANMPSVLAEIGFLTNAADEALLRKSEQRDKIAEALYKGIASYAETLSHFQVAKGQ
jgi:N-acetylmuramoyl-L-alanine amidase